MFVLPSGQEKKYGVKKRRLLKGKSVPEYAAIEPRGKGLMVASQKPFVFTHVDGAPLEQPGPEPMQVENTGGSEVPKRAGIAVTCGARGLIFSEDKIKSSAPL